MATQNIRPINDDLRTELLAYLRANGGDAVNLDGDSGKHLLRRVANLTGSYGHEDEVDGVLYLDSGPFKGSYAYPKDIEALQLEELEQLRQDELQLAWANGEEDTSFEDAYCRLIHDKVSV